MTTIFSKRIETIKKIQAILLIIATLTFFAGLKLSTDAEEVRKYQKASKQFEISVTDKENKISYPSYAICTFNCVIKNNSKFSASNISGIMKITDKQGKQLSYGKASFSGDFTPGEELTFSLDWEMKINDNTVEIWNSDFDSLCISFEITEITFEDYGTFEIEEN